MRWLLPHCWTVNDDQITGLDNGPGGDGQFDGSEVMRHWLNSSAANR